MAGLPHIARAKERLQNARSRKNSTIQMAESAGSAVSSNVSHGPNGSDRGLATTIQAEIIPRLMLAHGSAGTSQRQPAERSGPKGIANPADVLELARLCVTDEVPVARAFVQNLLDGGLAIDTALLELVTPAARTLGEAWTADHVTFTEVTLGLSRLHLLTRELTRDYVCDFDAPLGGQQVVLTPAPGEQHTLGLHMLEAYFRRAGWDVWVAPSSREADLVNLVSRDRVTMLGISIGFDQHLASTADLIRSVKVASMNPNIVVMVGGASILQRPEHAKDIKATTWAADPNQAVEYMERFRTSATRLGR